MSDSTGEPVSGSALRYTDGQYIPERFRRWSTRPPTLRGRRIFSRTLHAVHRPWFAVRLPRGVGVLFTTGRRTGRLRRAYVKAIRDGDRAYLVSIPGVHALWYKNIQHDPRVELHLPGGGFEGRARELRDDAERRQAYDAFCGRVHPFDYVENAFHRRGRPSRSKIIELHEAWFDGGHPLVIDLGRPVRRRR
ncbi:nitroreductase family deazaflavin-dependent oxidoreductase [Nocardia mexicana]|uniref:Deazaflavin-dependent oxidoreductase (Nitroreductase family) n=1 Tax=Nocardia mexicana TaxID=279262 RepID=A0A370H5U1_9NOCA|nr:nitroreductase family deazaflavin-dependent oxidoreductase [Nocardia mexicana]RDI50862.1 deazaflavin-dependent oxidoreductase (nitroreductase family) [Nocardia mexicana]